MAGKPDTAGIGQDRATQDPEQAARSSEGTYKDAVESLSDSDRLLAGLMPKAPDPSPFVIKG